MEQQTPIPPNQEWTCAKGNNTPFFMYTRSYFERIFQLFDVTC